MRVIQTTFVHANGTKRTRSILCPSNVRDMSTRSPSRIARFGVCPSNVQLSIAVSLGNSNRRR